MHTILFERKCDAVAVFKKLMVNDYRKFVQVPYKSLGSKCGLDYNSPLMLQAGICLPNILPPRQKKQLLCKKR